MISVPTGEWAFDSTCPDNDGWEYSFAGIDGSITPGSADGYHLFTPGLVSGVVEAVDCASPGGNIYAAFVGYWPLMNASPFDVNPGDVVFAQVSVQNSCSGQAFIGDLTTGVNSSYGIGVGSCPFIGHNAEWTVTRACCDGPGPDGEWYFPNTTNIFFDGAWADTGNTDQFYPGSQASSTIIMTMTNDNESSQTEQVESGSSGWEGKHAILFTTTGCAEEGGCTP